MLLRASRHGHIGRRFVAASRVPLLGLFGGFLQCLMEVGCWREASSVPLLAPFFQAFALVACDSWKLVVEERFQAFHYSGFFLGSRIAFI